ncbi:E3 ubiquitin-protein ligase RNF14 [Exaiptasia diaphana]|uniref:RBR-type E3 ubiquitin transferase n=1 Tax=Exaiptasia diaphana TaxID=2652724 RepID=A0A913Y4S5_EXADI|nr:E3 ubiquitin-protein ligase RNF14 [Exaiptasia diaphana]KXJ28953.1 E3 ubiquitin-protein ligase RNF14 [Exaiptasia diaphana]
MAVCMDNELENAITEQLNEVELLQSIYHDGFHLIREYDENNRIEFNLMLSVRHPHEKVTVEAVIPLEVEETVQQSSNGEKKLDYEESLVEKEDKGTADKDILNNSDLNDAEGPNDDPSPGHQHKKPGLSRMLSTKHLHIKSDVSELTPINLWCRLPPLYPSQIPPQFILSCDWLSTSQIDKLTQELDGLWQDNCHDPIIFTWADWLQSSSWDFLQLPSHLVLREGFKECLFNDGVTDVALEMALLSIFEHDLEVKRNEFYKSVHTCEICFEEKEGRAFCFLDECHHFCCVECLQQHSEMHIKSGSVMQLLCPINECDVAIPPQMLKDILEEEMYRRWERLLLNKTLDLMPDVFYCPRCNTAVVADDDSESSKLGRCTFCFFTFCIECQGPWHHGKSCTGDDEQEEQDKKKTSKKKQINKSSNKVDVFTKRSRTSNVAFITLMRSRGSYQKCPKCRMIVEKISGCNFMTCSQCRGQFCWVCGKSISSYGHFSQSEKCATFGQATPLQARQPEPSKGELLIQQYKEENPGKKLITKHCPVCSQKNIKIANNNSMKCWSCKTRFCYQCGKKIEGVCYKHFTAPNKCTQHSDD